ncbi:MAG TPA: hypothetical protein PLO51_01135, partial [Candidatus Micrarchaeota archaeon]|nr:hypothetical protein [Candidatus Micrarchaeota archaeon]
LSQIGLVRAFSIFMSIAFPLFYFMTGPTLAKTRMVKGVQKALGIGDANTLPNPEHKAGKSRMQP